MTFQKKRTKRFFSIYSTVFIPLLSSFSTAALYNSLDPQSVAESLAFYELYSSTKEGEKAFVRAATLLAAPSVQAIYPLVPHINRLKEASEELSEEDIVLIETLASHFPNRQLKGYQAVSEEEIISLLPEEIDLGRALILSQLSSSLDAVQQARKFSAMLDLMALQILARLPQSATPIEKIHATNRFIFEEMHFRFPPQSIYTENIDRYTFLPSVMDNHLGVCLGVTALYLSVAQRIGLPLEIVTPPGHIYARYRDGDKTINIETTARGIHMEDETYLSIQSPSLQQRTIKEVIGMTHVNQASTYLYKAEYTKAVHAYEKALPYMPQDPLLKELLGYSYLFTEKKMEGIGLLKEIGKGMHTIAEDYLNGKVDLDGIEAVLMLVDENRESLLCKQKKLEEILKKYPEFRDGLHQLAVTWIQLNRLREAIAILMQSHELDKNDALTAYYLAILHEQRSDYKNSWYYLHCAEAAIQKENFYPKVLKDLRRNLDKVCPEPLIY